MEPATRAVIDVGTNSVKLLVGIVEGGNVRPLLEKSEQTRLGEGFYETHHLQSAKIHLTAETVGIFAKEASGAYELSSLRVIATSAVRDAHNKQELVDAIQRACGHLVEVISGDQEADWVFAGVTSDPVFATEPLLVIDVGGGSTEIIAGRQTKTFYRQSFKMGTVRALESLHLQDPPSPDDWKRCHETLSQFLRSEITPPILPLLEPGFRLVATGGTATILARIKYSLRSFERDKIEGTLLALPELREITERLWSLPLIERKRVVGLPPKRADVILTGVAIYIAVMEQLRFEELYVSTRGLRYAALLQHPPGR